MILCDGYVRSLLLWNSVWNDSTFALHTLMTHSDCIQEMRSHTDIISALSVEPRL